MKADALERELKEVLAVRSERVVLGALSLSATPWFFFDQLARAFSDLLNGAQREVEVREAIAFESPVALTVSARPNGVELRAAKDKVELVWPIAVEEAQKAFRLWQKSYTARAKSPMHKALVALRLAQIDGFDPLLAAAKRWSGKPLTRELPEVKGSALELYRAIALQPFPFELTGAPLQGLPERFELAMMQAIAALKKQPGYALSLVGRHLLFARASDGRVVVYGDVLLPDADALAFDPRAVHAGLVFLRDHAPAVEGSFGLVEGRFISL